MNADVNAHGNQSTHGNILAIEAGAGHAPAFAPCTPRCDGCGAPVDEASTRCAYCGTPRSIVVKLEDETRALLSLLEARLEEFIKLRTDVVLILVFFLFIISGPVCYFALGLYTDSGVLVRAAAAIATSLFGFTFFGWQCNAREDAAEQIAWRDLIASEINRFLETKELTATEFIAMAVRLLNQDSRLRKVMLKWLPS